MARVSECEHNDTARARMRKGDGNGDTRVVMVRTMVTEVLATMTVTVTARASECKHGDLKQVSTSLMYSVVGLGNPSVTGHISVTLYPYLMQGTYYCC